MPCGSPSMCSLYACPGSASGVKMEGVFVHSLFLLLLFFLCPLGPVVLGPPGLLVSWFRDLLGPLVFWSVRQQMLSFRNMAILTTAPTTQFKSGVFGRSNIVEACGQSHPIESFMRGRSAACRQNCTQSHKPARPNKRTGGRACSGEKHASGMQLQVISNQQRFFSQALFFFCASHCPPLFSCFLVCWSPWSTQCFLPVGPLIFSLLCLILSFRLSIYLSSMYLATVSVCLSVYLSLSRSLSIYLFIYLSLINLPSYLTTYLATYLPNLSIYLSIYLTTYLSICLSIDLSICLSTDLSTHLSIYLSICLSISLSLYHSVLSIYR